MRCPCGSATWYGDKCLAGHPRPDTSPKTKIRQPSTAGTKAPKKAPKAVDPDPIGPPEQAEDSSIDDNTPESEA